MHVFLSYCKSHVYELHSVLAATITFLLMFLIKKPVKNWVANRVEQKALVDEHYCRKKAAHLKRWNGVLVPATMVVAFVVFELIAAISPLIHTSYSNALIGGAIALTEYAVWEQLGVHRKGDE